MDMTNLDFHSDSPTDCITDAIYDAWFSYCNKLSNGYYEPGLEDSVKLHFASLLEKCLDLVTLYPDERFVVTLEKNLPLDGDKDYIDIVIEYHRGNECSHYPIEIKFKKLRDGAYDYGVVDSYIDIANLERQKANKNSGVKKAFFIFLTSDIAYTRKSNKGTRKILQ